MNDDLEKMKNFNPHKHAPDKGRWSGFSIQGDLKDGN